MTRYIVKRILMILLIVLGVVLILFVLLYSLPGSNISQMPIYGGGDALDSIFELINAGDNFFTKYIRYCFNILFHFNPNPTGTAGPPSADSLGLRVRNTMYILVSGVSATLIVGVPVGVYAAVRKNRLADRVINIVSLFFAAIPNYALATIITLVLAVYLRLLPVANSYTTPSAYIMPTLTIALGGIASIARTTRASMLEVLDRPFIIGLRSKGLKEAGVVYLHALKNALVPVISVLGGFITQMLCGTFVVEHFFNIPGLGSYMLRSVGQRSHFAILGCTVVIAIILSVMNLVSDILYSLINPQIRLRYAKSHRIKPGKEAEK